MVNYRLIFALLFIVTAFIAAILGISNVAKNSVINDAEDLGAEVRTYLRLVDYRCQAYPEEFSKLQDCLGELSDELEQLGDIKEQDYQDFNSKTNETGYLIIINEGRKSLESGNFTLLKNREVVDQGCSIQGSIDPGYTCKLTFNSSCETGDVLEARYGDTRAYLKTC